MIGEYTDLLHDLSKRLLQGQTIPENLVLKMLPDHGFLRNWVEQGVEHSAAHAIAQYTGGLTLLASLAPRHIRFSRVGAPTNFWTLLYSNPHTYKTWAVERAGDTLIDVNRMRHETEIASIEALQDRVIQVGTVGVFQPEFSAFLVSSTKTSNGVRARAELLKLYDCPKHYHRNTLTKQRGKGKNPGVVVDPLKIQDYPRMSLLAAATPSYINRYTSWDDWAGGLMSRFCFVYAHPERVMEEESDIPQEWRDYFIAWLKAYNETAKFGQNGTPSNPNMVFGQCLGFDEGASVFWKHWFHGRPQMPDERSKMAIARSWEQVPKKVSMLLAIERLFQSYIDGEIESVDLGRDWHITEPDLRRACYLGINNIASMVALAKEATDTQDGLFMRQILRAIPQTGATRKDLMRAIEAKAGVVDQLILTLRERDEIYTMADTVGGVEANVRYYRRDFEADQADTERASANGNGNLANPATFDTDPPDPQDIAPPGSRDWSILLSDKDGNSH